MTSARASPKRWATALNGSRAAVACVFCEVFFGILINSPVRLGAGVFARVDVRGLLAASLAALLKERFFGQNGDLVGGHLQTAQGVFVETACHLACGRNVRRVAGDQADNDFDD